MTHRVAVALSDPGHGANPVMWILVAILVLVVVGAVVSRVVLRWQRNNPKGMPIPDFEANEAGQQPPPADPSQ